MGGHWLVTLRIGWQPKPKVLRMLAGANRGGHDQLPWLEGGCSQLQCAIKGGCTTSRASCYGDYFLFFLFFFFLKNDFLEK